jgi:hypothetical protein
LPNTVDHQQLMHQIFEGSITAIDVTPLNLWDNNPDIDKITPAGGVEWARPPFNCAWLEDRCSFQWTVSGRQLRTGNLVFATPVPLPFALHVQDETGVFPEVGLVIFHFIAASDTREAVLFAAITIPLDKNGCSLRPPGESSDKIFLNSVPDKHNERAGYLLKNSWEEVLTVYSLLNAKNIELRPTHKADHKEGPRNKRGIDWHTLHIKVPGVFCTDSTDPFLPFGQLARAHLVRGHFKVYTDDAPLFGQFTGRYWWTPHVRGDESKGVVEKDYVLHHRETEATS